MALEGEILVEPYPEEFKSVSAMECFSMLVVFFTYGGVLMMEQSLASADRDDVCDNCFTPREWFFFFLIMAVNFSFMVVIMLMVAWDIWRKSHHHIKKHGIKVTLALGGWNDSKGGKYSKLVNNPAARARFIEHVIKFIEKHDFDGNDS